MLAFMECLVVKMLTPGADIHMALWACQQHSRDDAFTAGRLDNPSCGAEHTKHIVDPEVASNCDATALCGAYQPPGEDRRYAAVLCVYYFRVLLPKYPRVFV